MPFVTVHGSGTAWFGEGARVTSIERTAYPQFKRLTSARVLHVFFTPAEDEAAWARERTESPEALLALVVDLKCFQKMARFCSREEIPRAVTDHVRHCLGLAPEPGDEVNLRPEPGETLGVGANLVGDGLALHQNRDLLTGQWCAAH